MQCKVSDTNNQAGWIKELLARLKESAPDGGPTINSTLDNEPATFPRGGKRLFVVSPVIRE